MELVGQDWAWGIIRVVMAWMFLMPIPGLLADWKSTQMLTRLVSGVCVNLLSVLSIAMMVLGALSILLGLYAQIGGILLFVYCIIGMRVHFKLGRLISSIQLPDVCRPGGEEAFGEVKSLGIVGQVTSAQKNVVLAGVALAFAILGSGAISITGNLW
jgi:uncharacterized membrane protein YphA (DoxX/SURF4 family)